MLLGLLWELMLLFPQVVGVVSIYKGLMWAIIQLFMDLYSLRFQLSKLVELQEPSLRDVG